MVTHSRVYLGIGGREFRIESKEADDNDFQKEAEWTYILGKDPLTVEPNDPPKKMTVRCRTEAGKNSILEHYPLDTNGPEADTNFRFPVYIRLDADEYWALQGAFCSVNPGTSNFLYYTTIWDSREEYIWLGPDSGEICYLRSYRVVNRQPG